MATVAYLLGAGASAQCIPVVKGMKDDIREVSKNVFDHFAEQDDSGAFGIPSSNTSVSEIITMLNSLSKICGKYYSIDTYAKKLFLTDSDKFNRLKLDLSLYFTLRQIWKDPDKRYDNFFSSIITSKGKLPSKIKIVSWNYDFQIEKSFLEFDTESDIVTARDKLGLTSISNWKNHNKYAEKFNIIKLNGSAIINADNHNGFLFSDLNFDKKQMVEEIIGNYSSIIESQTSFVCELKFAWETEHYEDLFSSAKADLKGIEVLVVVGYSFPFFNREVDMKLFASMPNLEKIYIQDKNPEFIKETMEEFVRLNIGLETEIEVVQKRNLEQFVFPYELEVTERTLNDL